MTACRLATITIVLLGAFLRLALWLAVTRRLR